MQEYNDALTTVLRYTKQHWPNLRTPKLSPECLLDAPIPQTVNKVRIVGSGSVDDARFIGSGVSDLNAVMNIAEVYGFAGGTVVDWGVGCGRMIRHLHPSLRGKCVGVDIDWVNVGWCVENLPHGQYHKLEPFGDMPVAAKSVDLLYSHSVMTHLSEVAQIHWLQQINRTLRGIAVISVHGMYSATVDAGWIRIPEFTKAWLECGFKDSGMNNPDIADVAPDLYYKDVAHTPKYIYDVWGQHITVLDVIPGGFGGVHDAVVCVPKHG